MLGEEAGVADTVVCAELFEDGDAGGEQRFADVVAGETLALEQHDAEALAGEHGGGGGAAGAAADDGDVGGGCVTAP